MRSRFWPGKPEIGRGKHHDPRNWLLPTLLMVLSLNLTAAELPPEHPYFADSVYPLGHGDAAQQDALPVPGPANPGPVIPSGSIRYAASGPAQFGAYTSGPYPDGRRVLWANGLDRIVKIDFDTFEILATYWFDGSKRWTAAEADAALGDDAGQTEEDDEGGDDANDGRGYDDDDDDDDDDDGGADGGGVLG